MNYLEIEQFKEALNYIEKELPENKYSDEYFNKKLNSFQRDKEEVKKIQSRDRYSVEIFKIPNKIADGSYAPGEQVRFNDSVTCGLGSTDEQLNIFRAILLSARFNYDKYEKKLAAVKADLEENMENDTFDGRDIQELERIRQKTVNNIRNTPGIVGKILYLAGHGNVINDGLKNIAGNKIFKAAAVNKRLADTTKRMLADGLSLTQISNCLNRDLPFIYKLAENTGLSLGLSAEEEEIIRKAEKEAVI